MNKQLSPRSFIISIILILLVSLGFLGGLYYFLNKDFPKIEKKETVYNPVTKEPVSFNLEINNPEDDLLMYDKSVVVSGSTSPETTILITNGERNYGTEADNKGSFSRVVELQPGLNALTVNAFNETGETKSVTKTVYYSQEKLTN